jgi:hypothetical protein
LRFSAAMPFSINSTSMRVALSLLDFAIARTCVAVLTGRLMLCRTVFAWVPTAPLCTKLVHLVSSDQRLRLPHPSNTNSDVPGIFWEAATLTSPNLLAEFHSMFSARLTSDFDLSTGETPSSEISSIPAKTQATGSAT